MSDLRNFDHADLASLAGTRALSKAGVAEGTNTHTIKTAAPNGAGTDYTIGGQAYHLADTDNIAMTAAAAQAADTTAWYLVSVNAAGTVLITKGTETATASYSASTANQLPAVPAGNCPLAAMKVVTVAVTFTSGTTDLSASGITATFFDLSLVPTGTPA